MKKILVADDEEIIFKTICRTLKGQPYEMVYAPDGVQALAKAQSEKPDLILLDINMPRKDGRETVQELRIIPATKAIPVIFLTGLDDTVDKIAGFELGADDYITKPFDPDLLSRRIQAILSR